MNWPALVFTFGPAVVSLSALLGYWRGYVVAKKRYFNGHSARDW